MQKTPLILLLSLTAVLIFIVGIRYGQHVESTNKQNAYNFSLIPKVVPSTPAKQIKYGVFTHKPCKVEFVIPDNLKKTTESSVSAVFQENSKNVLSFICDQTGSGSAELNPYTGKKIYFTVDPSLKALLDNSLTFLR